MYVETKTLSPAIQNALKSVGYGAADITVEAVTEVDSYSEGGSGQRGFVVVVNLDTGKFEGKSGSWGGGNMFTHSPVDSGDARIPIPENGAVIKGTRGYPRTFATLYANPAAMGRMLPSAEQEELTTEEQNALYAYGFTGSYRKEQLQRDHVSSACVDSLVERGYLKRSKNGATQMTTKGKNSRTRKY